MCVVFYDTLYKILDDNVPLRKTSKIKYPAWFTSEIIATLKLKFDSHSKYKKYRREDDLNKFKYYRTTSKKLIASAWNNFISVAERNINNQREYLWNFINCKKRNTRIPGQMNHNGVSIDSPQDIVDTFAKYFASVYVSPRNVSTKDCENIFTLIFL